MRIEEMRLGPSGQQIKEMWIFPKGKGFEVKTKPYVDILGPYSDKEALNNEIRLFLCQTCKEMGVLSRIKKVIYNGPTTIVLWHDGTKSIAKCDKKDLNDGKYSKETGLMVCVLKKLLGNADFHAMLEKYAYREEQDHV